MVYKLASYPDRAREPAVFHCIIQIEVIVEVTVQGFLLLLITNSPKKHCSPCRAHCHTETSARWGLVARWVQPGPRPLLCRHKQNESKRLLRRVRQQQGFYQPVNPSLMLQFSVPWPSLPSRFNTYMSEWMVPFSTSFLTLWHEQTKIWMQMWFSSSLQTHGIVKKKVKTDRETHTHHFRVSSIDDDPCAIGRGHHLTGRAWRGGGSSWAKAWPGEGIQGEWVDVVVVDKISAREVGEAEFHGWLTSFCMFYGYAVPV